MSPLGRIHLPLVATLGTDFRAIRVHHSPCGDASHNPGDSAPPNPGRKRGCHFESKSYLASSAPALAYASAYGRPALRERREVPWRLGSWSGSVGLEKQEQAQTCSCLDSRNGSSILSWVLCKVEVLVSRLWLTPDPGIPTGQWRNDGPGDPHGPEASRCPFNGWKKQAVECILRVPPRGTSCYCVDSI